jgi:hypothetical protein
MSHNTPQDPDAVPDPRASNLWGPVGDPDPVREYRKQARTLQASAPDGAISHLDWLVARVMAARGYSPDAIRRALLEASPHWADHAAEHLVDVTHLVDEVMQLPDVIIARKLILGADDEFGLGF